jgi:hypothetical protein
MVDDEGRHVSKFCFDEGTPVKVIIARLKKHYGEDAIFPSMVYHWVK